MSGAKRNRRLEQFEIRQAIKAAEKTMERTVWMLPSALLDRVVAYQRAELLPSEVAAARQLLDAALTAFEARHAP